MLFNGCALWSEFSVVLARWKTLVMNVEVCVLMEYQDGANAKKDLLLVYWAEYLWVGWSIPAGMLHRLVFGGGLALFSWLSCSQSSILVLQLNNESYVIVMLLTVYVVFVVYVVYVCDFVGDALSGSCTEKYVNKP